MPRRLACRTLPCVEAVARGARARRAVLAGVWLIPGGIGRAPHTDSQRQPPRGPCDLTVSLGLAVVEPLVCLPSSLPRARRTSATLARLIALPPTGPHDAHHEPSSRPAPPEHAGAAHRPGQAGAQGAARRPAADAGHVRASLRPQRGLRRVQLHVHSAKSARVVAGRGGLARGQPQASGYGQGAGERVPPHEGQPGGQVRDCAAAATVAATTTTTTNVLPTTARPPPTTATCYHY